MFVRCVALYYYFRVQDVLCFFSLGVRVRVRCDQRVWKSSKRPTGLALVKQIVCGKSNVRGWVLMYVFDEGVLP